MIDRRWLKGAKHLDTLSKRIMTVVISLDFQVQLAVPCAVNTREIQTHRSTGKLRTKRAQRNFAPVLETHWKTSQERRCISQITLPNVQES